MGRPVGGASRDRPGGTGGGPVQRHCTARQGKGRRKAGGAQPRPPEGSSGRKEAGGMWLGSLPPAVNSAPQIKPTGSTDWKCSSFLFVLDYGIIITLNKVQLEFLRLKKEAEAGVGAGREGGVPPGSGWGGFRQLALRPPAPRTPLQQQSTRSKLLCVPQLAAFLSCYCNCMKCLFKEKNNNNVADLEKHFAACSSQDGRM